MPGPMDEMRTRLDAAERELSSLKRGMSGVSPENLQQFFLMHAHDGTAMGGKPLYGPYLIRDVANGHTYQIISRNGSLTLQLVS